MACVQGSYSVRRHCSFCSCRFGHKVFGCYRLTNALSGAFKATKCRAQLVGDVSGMICARLGGNCIAREQLLLLKIG